jgi:hypothetical protein
MAKVEEMKRGLYAEESALKMLLTLYVFPLLSKEWEDNMGW